jgi:hypothetical protein
MEIVKTKEYNRKKFQEQATLPVAKGLEVTYPFQWLLFRPQLHAIEPFQTNKATRVENTHRGNEKR